MIVSEIHWAYDSRNTQGLNDHLSLALHFTPQIRKEEGRGGLELISVQKPSRNRAFICVKSSQA